MQNRNIGLVILFSIISCGIYMFYYVYKVSEELEAEGQTGSLSPIVVLLLTIFVSPVGFLLLGMNGDANINAIKAKRGMPQADNKVLWMILGLIIPIVLIVLMQLEINNLCPEA